MIFWGHLRSSPGNAANASRPLSYGRR
jgi:hypothetical protein